MNYRHIVFILFIGKIAPYCNPTISWLTVMHYLKYKKFKYYRDKLLQSVLQIKRTFATTCFPALITYPPYARNTDCIKLFTKTLLHVSAEGRFLINLLKIIRAKDLFGELRLTGFPLGKLKEKYRMLNYYNRD